MGDHHTQDRCTSPMPCKTTSLGGDDKRMPQEKMARWSPNNLPIKLPWVEKQEVAAWIMDIYQSIH